MSDETTPRQREQHYIDPVTGQKKSITVHSIKDKIKRGKGGALAGAISQPAVEKSLKSKTKSE